MRPSYEEIIEINPLLKKRPKEDIEKLLNTIINNNYKWDERKKYFYNEELGMHIRTQGLDLFDSERFEKTFRTWSDKKYSVVTRSTHKWIRRLLIIFLLDLILGWFFMSIKIWIASLILIGLLISLKRNTFKVIKEKK